VQITSNGSGAPTFRHLGTLAYAIGSATLALGCGTILMMIARRVAGPIFAQHGNRPPASEAWALAWNFTLIHCPMMIALGATLLVAGRLLNAGSMRGRSTGMAASVLMIFWALACGIDQLRILPAYTRALSLAYPDMHEDLWFNALMIIYFEATFVGSSLVFLLKLRKVRPDQDANA
jgi:hypothetical protein